MITIVHIADSFLSFLLQRKKGEKSSNAWDVTSKWNAVKRALKTLFRVFSIMYNRAMTCGMARDSVGLPVIVPNVVDIKVSIQKQGVGVYCTHFYRAFWVPRLV